MVDPTCSDLATKAELQELRDQLNAALGDLEDGGQTTVFEKGKDATSIAGAIAVTFLGSTKIRASNAITDIAVQTTGSSPIWKELGNGTAKLLGFKGNGQQKVLDKLGDVTGQIGKNGGAATGAAAVAAKNMAMLSVLMSLVNIAATLALNHATVKVFDYRIDQESRGTQVALDGLNNSMLRLYDKHQGDIDAINAEIEANNNLFLQAQNNITAQGVEISKVKDNNNALGDKLTEAEDSISTLQSELATVRNTVNQNAADFQEVVDELIASINTVEAELGQAIELVNQNRVQLAKANQQIAELEIKINDLNEKWVSSSTSYALLREEFNKLKLDIAENKDLSDARSKLVSARLTILENRNTKGLASGGAASAMRGTADSQTKQLTLMGNLADPVVETPTITATDIQNDTSTYDDTFRALLPLINPGNVNQQQIDDLVTRINEDFGSQLDLKLGAGVIPGITTLIDQTTQPSISDAVEKGICNSLNNPGGCSGGGASPTHQGLSGLFNNLQNNIDSLNAGLNATIIGQNSAIKSIVQSTNDVVKSAEFGVKKAFELADKAWKATHADKILNVITTAMVIHNGVQLSTNLASTVTETASVVLDAMGIEDSDGKPFDVTTIIRTKLNAILTSLVGAENYAALTTKVARFNRIYQSTANVLDATRDLFDSAHSVAELTAENTGQIGNALLESGVVAEDSYRKMIDDINPQSKALSRIESFRGKLDTIEDTVSTIDNIASEVVSTKDSYRELIEVRDEWKTDIEENLVIKETATTTAKNEVQVTATIDDASFERNETAEGDV